MPSYDRELYKAILAEEFRYRRQILAQEDVIDEENVNDVLTHFVYESNEIEEYNRETDGAPGTPIFDNHMEAARVAYFHLGMDLRDNASRYSINPNLIHSLLMQAEEDHTPGVPRKGDVYIGGRKGMAPHRVEEYLPELIDKACKMLDRAKESGRKQNKAIWKLHNEFEFIHPYSDGNGRTGRLWLNVLRTAVGMPWLTIYASHRFGYYQEIINWIDSNEHKYVVE